MSDKFIANLDNIKQEKMKNNIFKTELEHIQKKYY